MNTMRKSLIYQMATLLLVTGSFRMQAQSQYSLLSGYAITINGSSNVHDWTETAVKTTGDATITWTDGSFTINHLSLKIEVAAIESEHGSIMDNKTYDALKAKNYPYISFKMTSLKSMTKSGTGYLVKVMGDLTIAGKTRNVELTAMAYIKENGKILFDGSRSLKMTEYGIDPPTAMMGAMQVGDDVTVKFKVYFGMK